MFCFFLFPHDGISALIKRDIGELALSLSTLRGHSNEAAMCKPGSDPLSESDHAGMLIMDW